MKVRFKKLHRDAKPPIRMTNGAAGYDLTAVSLRQGRGIYRYDTGLAIEVPKGHVGLLFPRSSSYKTGLLLSNCVGVLDSDYRGSILFVFWDIHYASPPYEVGDRIGQLIIMKIPDIEFVEADELTDTDRGAGGYGSTGK